MDIPVSARAAAIGMSPIRKIFESAPPGSVHLGLGQPTERTPESILEMARQALAEFGQPALPVGAHSPGYVAATDEQAREEMWPHYVQMQERIGRERGWGRMSRAQFDAGAGPDGALFVGSPATVAAKIVRLARGLGLSRFDMKYSAGTLPHELLMTSIELYGSEVAPLVREGLAAG